MYIYIRIHICICVNISGQSASDTPHLRIGICAHLGITHFRTVLFASAAQGPRSIGLHLVYWFTLSSKMRTNWQSVYTFFQWARKHMFSCHPASPAIFVSASSIVHVWCCIKLLVCEERTEERSHVATSSQTLAHIGWGLTLLVYAAVSR
jgi:hypothetical protein